MILPTDGDPPARRLGLHTASLPANRRRARALLNRAFDLGVRLIDTGLPFANTDHTPALRRVLRDRPDGTLIAASAAMTRCRPDDLFANGRPVYLRKQADDSRRRLRVDRIDLLNVHINTAIDLDGQIEILLDMRSDGTINHIGLTSPTITQLDTVREHLPVAAVSHTYNLAERDNDDVLDAVSEAAWVDDARFNGEHHVLLNDRLIDDVHERRFMDGDAHGVAKPMRECFTVSGVLDDLPGLPIDFTRGDLTGS
jgi:aryl-alcohol dehydrogenase-like predicted oxidoreductase